MPKIPGVGRLPIAKLKKEIADLNGKEAIRSEADLQAHVWHFLTEKYKKRKSISIHCEPLLSEFK